MGPGKIDLLFFVDSTQKKMRDGSENSLYICQDLIRDIVSYVPLDDLYWLSRVHATFHMEIFRLGHKIFYENGHTYILREWHILIKLKNLKVLVQAIRGNYVNVNVGEVLTESYLGSDRWYRGMNSMGYYLFGKSISYGSVNRVEYIDINSRMVAQSWPNIIVAEFYDILFDGNTWK